MWSKLQSSSKAFYCHNVPSCLEKHRKRPQVSLPTPRTTQAVSRSAVKFPKCPRLGATAMSGCIMAWYSSTLSVAFSDPTATVTTAMLCCVLSSTAALNTEGMMSSTPGSTGPWSLAEGLNPGSVSGEQDWSRSHGTSGLYSSHQSSGSSFDNAISTRDFTATKLLFFHESRLQVAKDMSNQNQKHSSYFAIMLSFSFHHASLSSQHFKSLHQEMKSLLSKHLEVITNCRYLPQAEYWTHPHCWSVFSLPPQILKPDYRHDKVSDEYF